MIYLTDQGSHLFSNLWRAALLKQIGYSLALGYGKLLFDLSITRT
jgi:hypothetical protein